MHRPILTLLPLGLDLFSKGAQSRARSWPPEAMAGPGGAKKPVLEIDKLYTVDPSILIGLGRENDRLFVLQIV